MKEACLTFLWTLLPIFLYFLIAVPQEVEHQLLSSLLLFDGTRENAVERYMYEICYLKMLSMSTLFLIYLAKTNT